MGGSSSPRSCGNDMLPQLEYINSPFGQDDTHPVIDVKRGEIGCAGIVHDAKEPCAEGSIDRRELDARVEALLQEVLDNQLPTLNASRLDLLFAVSDFEVWH